MKHLTGEELRKLRKDKRYTQEALANKIGVSRTTIYDWERGAYFPVGSNLTSLAAALDTSVSYLMGEKDDPSPLVREPEEANKVFEIIQGGKSLGHIGTKAKDGGLTIFELIPIPLLSIETAASCGAGNGLYGVTPETSKSIFVDPCIFRKLDDTRKPFGIHTEGDSMTGAGLDPGNVAIVNPADEVNSGDMALVVWNDNWFIKWVVFMPDGNVELRSANPAYGSIVVDSELAEKTEWFRIVGKVVEIIENKRPKRAF